MTSQSIRSHTESAEFSGVVSFRIGGQSFEEAFGHRDRANTIPNNLETRFGIASGTKGFTAIAVGRLIEDGLVRLDTPVRSLPGEMPKNLHPEITILHLLDHTSGIGDYLDEERGVPSEEAGLRLPVRSLESPRDYLPLLEKAPCKFRPGERFSYSNSGFVALALAVEHIASEPFCDFVQREVFDRAEMTRSGFFRSDCLPENTANGYVRDGNGWRTNLFHLPVRGCGDGGAYSTAHDIGRFWLALRSGNLLTRDLVEEFLMPRHSVETESKSYGCGFWLCDKKRLTILEGYDAGVSFQSVSARDSEDGFTVISNTSSGAWPIARRLMKKLAG